MEVRVVHERGSGDAPRPLPLHGRPCSFASFAGIVDALAHPERHGGRVQDAFTVVVPLPPDHRMGAAIAVAAFPDPVFPAPPPATVTRSHHLVRCTTMPRGGHFPFHEAPDLLIADLRAVAHLPK